MKSGYYSAAEASKTPSKGQGLQLWPFDIHRGSLAKIVCHASRLDICSIVAPAPDGIVVMLFVQKLYILIREIGNSEGLKLIERVL